jgi:hypothetical protein
MISVVDFDAREDQAGYSASNSLLFGVRRKESAWLEGAVESAVWGGLQRLSLIRARSMPRAQGMRKFGAIRRLY